ncbi:MAG: DUF1499 domain-containing protein, partial [Balneolaceae bacterium]|nr:DUF1499 domain-containing protein [Balneolaceae bacterium]
CPDSPNCARVTKQLPASADDLWEHSLTALKEMKPYDITLEPDEYRIESVFLVFFFRDDFTLQIIGAGESSSYLHVRSASRVGYSDLGVNTRRIRTYLKQLNTVTEGAE